MAWVHAWSCIIYIRKESNVLDAENLTHRVQKKKESVHTTYFSCDVGNVNIRAVY